MRLFVTLLATLLLSTAAFAGFGPATCEKDLCRSKTKYEAETFEFYELMKGTRAEWSYRIVRHDSSWRRQIRLRIYDTILKHVGKVDLHFSNGKKATYRDVLYYTPKDGSFIINFNVDGDDWDVKLAFIKSESVDVYFDGEYSGTYFLKGSADAVDRVERRWND